MWGASLGNGQIRHTDIFGFLRILLCGACCAIALPAQSHLPESEADSDAGRGVKLAWSGKCSDAMPLLDASMRSANYDEAAKRAVSYAGVMCSMQLNQEVDALSFLSWLQAHFSVDPDVLFLATNVFAELSDRSAKELMKRAPGSTEAIEFNAENFERHGDFTSAIAEYRVLLGKDPSRAGIHYRIGALILAQPDTPKNEADARNEFEQEIKIDPESADAQYYLGELDRGADSLPAAITHFTRATELQPGLGEAWLGLGRSLLDSGKPADAIQPLEQAEKLIPDNPTLHLALGTAYRRVGRTEQAEREFAQQKTLSQKINDNAKTLRRNVDGLAPSLASH